jgi:hypothetical protein
MNIFARVARWFAVNLPSDEQMEVENEAAIKQRMNDLEVNRAIARRQLAEIHERNTTQSPIHRRAS